MNKYIIKLVACALIGILGASCGEDYLDVKPTDSIDSRSAVSTTRDAMASLNGIHRLMYAWGGGMSVAGFPSVMTRMNALGDDYVMTASGNGWFNGDYQWVDHRNENSWSSYYPYRLFYRIIDNANVIIHGVESASGDPRMNEFIKAQAYTYRAFAHLYLVQLYGKRYVKGEVNSQPGVPIMTENTFAGLPRASVEAVYAQVLTDLASAEEYFDKSGINRENKSHFDKSVVYGFRARVHLLKGEWADAQKYARLAKTGYGIMDAEDMKAGFNDYSNNEWMWGSHMQDDQSTYYGTFFAFISYNFSSTNIRTNPKAINSDLYANIKSTDVRHWWWDADPVAHADEWPMASSFKRAPYMSRKFAAASSSNSVGDICYMRRGEMELIDAEATAHLNEAEAATILTTFIQTRDAAYDATANGLTIQEEIQIQRRIELWGEGFRFLDLKRLNQPLVRAANHNATLCKQTNIPADSNMWEFMIPIEEVDANKNLGEQNPI